MKINDDLTVSPVDLEEFQKTICVKFDDLKYLIQALLHSSAFSGNKEKLDAFRQINGLENKDYEKLEHLGDSVLGLIVAEYAYDDDALEEYVRSNGKTIEGISTEIKRVLASNESLKPVANKIELDRFVIRGKFVNIENRYGDVIEALLAAIYLDKNRDIGPVKEFVYRFFDFKTALDKIDSTNPKGKLQERLQQKKLGLPEYRLINEEGPDHNKLFTVGLYVQDEHVSTGYGPKVRTAEKDAAEKYLKELSE